MTDAEAEVDFEALALKVAKENLPDVAGFSNLSATADTDTTNARTRVGRVMLKFYTRDKSLVPALIPIVERQPQYAIDVENQIATVDAGMPIEDGVPGRYRVGRVDTGANTIKLNRPVVMDSSGLTAAGFHFVRVDRWEQKSVSRKTGKDVITHVICALFERKALEYNPFRQALLGVVKTLAEGTVWGNCVVWDNPGKFPVTTVNLTEPFPPNQKPKREVLIEGDKIVVHSLTTPNPPPTA